MTLLFISLTACGFHLRGQGGDYELPFKTVYIDCGNVIICKNLQTTIKVQNLAEIVKSPDKAQVTLRLVDEQTSRQPQTFNSAGRIASYILMYQAVAQVWQKGEQVGNDINVSAQSVMQYNDSTVLANDQNEATFWDELHRNATNQLIRRLIHFKYENLDNNESK